MFDLTKIKLGKQAVKKDPRTLMFEKYCTVALPTPPEHLDFTSKVIKPWGMMKNDTVGDCTCAAAGHCIELWTANAKKKEVVPSDRKIILAYAAITGYDPVTGANDNGANELDVLNFWRKTGIAGHKIDAFMAFDGKDHRLLMDAIYLFGTSYIGVELPISAQSQEIWDVPKGGPHGNGAPGSWGGHAVNVVAYDAEGMWVVTWGQMMKMTWAFWDAYVSERYAICCKDWMNAKHKTTEGFNKAQLLADLSAFKVPNA